MNAGTEAGYEQQLAELLDQRGDRTPREIFGDVSDPFWLWINTDGYRNSAQLRRILPGLPDESVQRQWTNRAADEALAEGNQIYRLVRGLYERHVGEIGGADGILDFGCGWGRMVRFFLRDVDGDRLTGTDHNQSLIEFCNDSNRWCRFVRNGAEPPLPFADDCFSLAYAYSVFSHLSEPMHLAWLEELRRVVRPGGAIALSIRPREFIEYCRRIRESSETVEQPILLRMFPDADEQLARYDAGGYAYSPYDPAAPGAWWGEACVPRTYVEATWGELFDVREFVEAADGLRQHVVLLTVPEPA